MTDGEVDRSTRVRIPRVVLGLLAATLLLLIPVGLGLVWLAVVSPPATWSDLTRALVATLGIAEVALLSGVVLGAVRYNVLGLPPVRVQEDGLSIAGRRIDWAAITRVGAVRSAGVPWLTVEVPPAELRFLPWYDRLSARIQVPPKRRAREIWVTERQLDAPLADVLRRVPSGHLAR